MLGHIKATVLVAFGLILATLPGIVSTPAWACSVGTSSYGHQGAINQHEPTYGSSMDVYVNNFTSDQWYTWRSESVWQNSNNFAEVGWMTSSYNFNDQAAHPYRTRKNNGTLSSQLFPGITISNRDQLHTFVVKDTDDNNQYTSSYDGNQLGDPWFVSLPVDQSDSQVQSERYCDNDSLWAQFRHLQYYNAQANTVDWGNLNHNVWSGSAPYNYCPIDNTAFDVKQTC
jgi:hypothetical protein